MFPKGTQKRQNTKVLLKKYDIINLDDMNEENKIILYQDDDEITRVSVRFADEDLWLTQSQLADIYCTTQENVSMHIKNIYADRHPHPLSR